MTATLPPRFLSHAEVDTVIRLAPLIAIDLIIRNARDDVLLGLRKNEPAKGCYFVPGGMILKNEHLADAFARLAKTETDHAATCRIRRCRKRITSCSATNLDGRARQSRGPTTSTANCGGGPWRI
jgi:NUDIX domain